MRGRAVCLAMVLAWAANAHASVMVYFNQAQWQTAMSQSGTPLTDVNFDSAQWTSAFQATRGFDSLTSDSSLADGTTISAVAGYSPLGFANNALLGQATNGVWSDTLSKYGTTQFQFSTALHGFGGNFDIAASNGLEILAGSGTPFATPDGIYDGFIGVISTDAFNSILIAGGDNGNCFECFGNSYVLSQFEIGDQAASPFTNHAVATPEPSYIFVFGSLLVGGATFSLRRRRTG